MEKVELVDGVRLGCGGMRSGDTCVVRGLLARDGGGDCDVE